MFAEPVHSHSLPFIEVLASPHTLHTAPPGRRHVSPAAVKLSQPTPCCPSRGGQEGPGRARFGGAGVVSARRSCQLLVAPSRAPRPPLVPLFHSPQSPQVKGRKAGWVLVMRVAEGSYFTGQSLQNSVRLFWQHGAAIKGMWNSDLGSNSSPAGNPATQAAWPLVPGLSNSDARRAHSGS